MGFWMTKSGLKNQAGGYEKYLWMGVVVMVNMTSYLKCHPIVFQEESDEFSMHCVEALLLCVNVLVRFLF